MFHTGKHGQVYNDEKHQTGLANHSPGNHDGSSSMKREYPETNETVFNALSNNQKYLLTKHAGLSDFSENTDFEYSNFTRGERKVINQAMDELNI